MNIDKIKAAEEMIGMVTSDPATPEPVVAWATALFELINMIDVPDARFVKGSPIPESVGAMADEYSNVRIERLRIEKSAAQVKMRETELYNVVMSTLDESPDTGASGSTYRVQRIEKTRQVVKEWPELWKFIQATGSFDLLQKRLNDKAVNDQIEGGEPLPGVEAAVFATLSFTKI